MGTAQARLSMENQGVKHVSRVPWMHVVTKGLTVARPRPCPPRLCPALPLWRSCLCRCLFSEAPIECLPFLGPADSMLSLTAPPGLQPVGHTVAIWACGREHLPGTRHRWEPGRTVAFPHAGGRTNPQAAQGLRVSLAL